MKCQKNTHLRYHLYIFLANNNTKKHTQSLHFRLFILLLNLLINFKITWLISCQQMS